MRFLGLIPLIPLSLSLLSGCSKSAQAVESSGPPPAFSVDGDALEFASGAPRPVSFATEEAKLAPALDPPPVTGRIGTIESATQPRFAPLAGRIIESRVRLGDAVHTGDKLVKIRAADLSTLHHDLLAANLAINTKKAIVDRTQKLVENHAASENDLLVAKSELDEARLAGMSAGSKIDSLGVVAEGDTAYWLVATEDGTVVDADAAPGKEVGPDRDHPVVTIANLDEVLVVGDLRPAEAAQITTGTKTMVAIAGSDQSVAEGKIETLSEVIDPEKQTVPVRIRVPNAKHVLKPNGYVDLTFKPDASSEVIEVPTAAVVSDGAVSVVFLEESPGRFARRKVEVGRSTRERTEIKTGLKAGDHVVVVGALLLLNSLEVDGSEG